MRASAPARSRTFIRDAHFGVSTLGHLLCDSNPTLRSRLTLQFPRKLIRAPKEPLHNPEPIPPPRLALQFPRKLIRTPQVPLRNPNANPNPTPRRASSLSFRGNSSGAREQTSPARPCTAMDCATCHTSSAQAVAAFASRVSFRRSSSCSGARLALQFVRKLIPPPKGPLRNPNPNPNPNPSSRLVVEFPRKLIPRARTGPARAATHCTHSGRWHGRASREHGISQETHPARANRPRPPGHASHPRGRPARSRITRTVLESCSPFRSAPPEARGAAFSKCQLTSAAARWLVTWWPGARV